MLIRSRCLVRAFCATATLALSVTAHAQVLNVGGPATGGNAFPFGAGPLFGAATRYQQVYKASLFTAAYGGAVTIDSVSFFATLFGGDYRGGTYDMYLSTTVNPVDALSSVMDNNVGADNALFASMVLGGPMGTLTFGGSFLYDPSAGDLLIDIKVSGADPTPGFFGFMDARNGDFGGDSSRMHNFGGGFEGYGLVTEFHGTPSGGGQVPEPGSLAMFAGMGLGGAVFVLRRRRS